MTSELYRQHIVWRRVSNDRAARYVCYERLCDSRFSVQSCDFYSLPGDRDVVRQLEDQAVELFIETDPVERSGSFATLIEAIAAFDIGFESTTDDLPTA